MKFPRLFPLVAFTLFTAALSAKPRDDLWAQVKIQQEQKLPQSALATLNTILVSAQADHAWPEVIKATVQKISLENIVSGAATEERILHLIPIVEQAPPETKPLFEAVLARWYWSYIQQQRLDILARTSTATAPSPDFRTWDLPRLMAEAERHFTAALADPKRLQRIPVAAYDGLLDPGTAPDANRPTLYDFLAYEALSFYESSERDLVNVEDGFTVSADSPVFAPAADFIGWHPATIDAESPVLKALRLHQELLAFHRRDRDLSAYCDADLARLLYAHRIATGDDENRRYEAALERFIANASRYESSARALAELAGLARERGDEMRAHTLAQRGFKAFAHTAGGARCANILQEVEAKSAVFRTESIWTAPWPTLDITYRNVTKVYFRAVADDVMSTLADNHNEQDSVQRLLKRAPALTWQSGLPPTRDYKPRTVALPAPTKLKPGFYCIIASHNPDFTDDKNQISATWIWVSDLVLVTQQVDLDAKIRGFVLRAATGEPVPGATVRAWQSKSYNAPLVATATVTTDENGQFSVPSQADRELWGSKSVFLASYDGQSVSNLTPAQSNQRIRDLPLRKDVIFFTDRAIYRPGQTIHYKGVCFQYDRTQARYGTIAGLPFAVIFYDANTKEVARATHKTNAFGSFSGTFTAPRGGVLGAMSLRTDGTVPGSVSFRVEEYKRPKFQVALTPAAEAPRLGTAIQVTVKATAYTGAAVGGALVKWSVGRNARVPDWCWWWRPSGGRPQPITHGTAKTSPDGTMEIQFNAEPDRSVPARNEPVFTYTVHADITDANGETRSADCEVKAGYTALKADLTADDWQTSDQPVICTVSTQSLTGAPQSATGRFTLQTVRQPASVIRAPLETRGYYYYMTHGTIDPESDQTNPETWAVDRVVTQQSFSTGADGTVKISTPLPAGLYRASVETKDRFGKTVTARRLIHVLDPQAAHCSVRIPFVTAAPAWSVEPGHTFTALWATGYDTGRAFVEFESAGRILKSGWTTPGRTQEMLSLPITEDLRGGVTFRVTFVRENRGYVTSQTVDVPWTDKKLDVVWETFRSKLLPGQAENWTAIVKGPAGKPVQAELVATLYDASLDQFAPHSWEGFSAVFRQESSDSLWVLQNFGSSFSPISMDWSVKPREAEWSYRIFATFPGDWLDEGVQVLSAFTVSDESNSGYLRTNSVSAPRLNAKFKNVPMSISVMSKDFIRDANVRSITDVLRYSTKAHTEPDLNQVTARKNLSETAFFFPHLLSDENGRVKFQFTMPEALTEWNFLGFAHDANLRSGVFTAKVVTAKDLMVEPNPPRFVREGDVIEFTAKVTNRTDQPQSGKVRLTLADAATAKSADGALGNTTPEQTFTVPAKESRSFAWHLIVPDGAGFLTYKVVGASASASDGEEGFLPVLSRRILVTESLPLSIRGAGTKEFEFTKLLASGQFDTLRHQSLTVQMVSQPAWYAVMALPYLMEFPHECSEQVFNRLYANALARHIANSDPKIRHIFEQWRNTPALDSPLEKNPDLKGLMIAETPWLRDTVSESQARRQVGLLFDAKRLDEETALLLHQLAERQLPGGLWSWFPGGRPDEYISTYLVAGFGRLRHLGVEVDVAPALKAIDTLDADLTLRHRAIINHTPHPADYVPTSSDAFYLYARSFFLADKPVAPANRDAVDFFLAQARKQWTKVGARQSEAHLALALQRFGDKVTPAAIARSLKERSTTTEEFGMFWRDGERSWWWYQAPVETQAMMIEVFDEIAHDRRAVEDCQAWLLKQKQTQNWPTTKATADAIYSLLLRGSNLLASDARVEVSLGGVPVKPAKVEAGTGFYEQKFTGGEIKPAMGRITVRKTDAGVAWGGVHWQYLEDMRKITPHEGTPLSLKKSLWIKENTARGPVLKPVTGPVAVGDELVVRLELRTDRDLEYVHLKDQRGSGTEPVNVLSEYKYQDGLAYYESTRDTASHFFIDRLPQGTYVFEYPVRVQLRGNYQSGIAEIQCMYAPEFNSHSESQTIEVK